MNIFVQNLISNSLFFWLVTLSVIPSICLHEYAHAQTALWMGDDTAARRGHLTLNPLRQMGWISLIMFLIIGIAWGAVPVNRNNLTRRGAVLVSLSGPLMNLFLAIFGAVLLLIMLLLHAHGIAVNSLLAKYFYYLGIYNLVLFLFNMLPVPGLDGWGVIAEFIPFRKVHSEWIKGIMLLLMLLLITCFDYIFMAAAWVMHWIPVLAEKMT